MFIKKLIWIFFKYSLLFFDKINGVQFKQATIKTNLRFSYYKSTVQLYMHHLCDSWVHMHVPTLWRWLEMHWDLRDIKNQSF